jgi:hypothetical protein
MAMLKGECSHSVPAANPSGCLGILNEVSRQPFIVQFSIALRPDVGGKRRRLLSSISRLPRLRALLDQSDGLMPAKVGHGLLNDGGSGDVPFNG